MNGIARRYAITIAICLIVVDLFAVIQYHLIQNHPFILGNYIIPTLVGGGFGFLIAYINILQIKYQKEKDQVIEKNKKIHLYVGTIVHDLKSPISAVYSIIELLLLQDEDLKSEKSRKFLGLMKSSTESMLENIQLILVNTKFESGKMQTHLEQGNPFFTINSTIDKHLILAINKSITIQRVIDRNMPNVEYDKQMLDRVLSNLISNSIKYSPCQTQIKIFSELLSDKLNLVVEDQGLGLSEEDLKKVFGEFMTLSSKPTGGEVSTGLGLSVAKKLAEEMGGTIWAESEGKGKGSTFKIALPLAPS